MRLLKRDADLSFSLASFTRDEIPPYTILSHTWGRGKDEEVTYKDLVDGSGQTKAGFKKLRFCAEQTQADGLSYFWIDTCCIDKSDHHELTTAINSMFRWYRNAVKCYVYLPDVSAPAGEGDVVKSTWEPDFSQSRWFKRGYTLQELLAPAIVEFYSRDGVLLGDKTTLQKMISRITGIPSKALKGSSLSDFSTSDILKWTENRQTTLEEDMAYCLLGIFDVSMSLIYGEGQERATKRLLREVAESQRQSARSYSALCRSRIRWYRFSTSRMLLFYEPELWTELVAAACSIDFYWTVVAVSLCSTRLIYLNLPEVTADSHLALRPHGYYPVAKLFAAVLAWYCLLVAITWCIALTPVHLVVPTYFDIWRPYMNVLPLQFSTSLVNLTKYDDFEMPFSISVALLRDTIDPIPSFIVPKPRNRDFIQRPVLISAIEEKFVGARQSHDARVALYGLGGTGKTQLALEYSYRARDKGLYSHIFWTSGVPEQFVEGYYKIASVAKLTVNRSEETRSMQLVQSWLEATLNHDKPWLLVVDALDTVYAPLEFLPKYGGHILLTARTPEVVTIYTNINDGINVEQMETTEAKELFVKLSSLQAEQYAQGLDDLLEELERLPLAILQAATFIRQISQAHEQPIMWYLQHFRKSLASQNNLLSKSWKTMYIDSDASSSVITTWKITFDHLALHHPNAARLFKMMVYLSPVQIPRNIFQFDLEDGAAPGYNLTTTVGPTSPSFTLNEIEVEEALGTLVSFAFISYSSDKSDIHIHRLVRLAMLAEMRSGGETQSFYQVLLILARTLPGPNMSDVTERSKLMSCLVELLSHPITDVVKDYETYLLYFELVIMTFMRLHGKETEAVQFHSSTQEQKKEVMGLSIVSGSIFNPYDESSAPPHEICRDIEDHQVSKQFFQLLYEILLKRHGHASLQALGTQVELAKIERLPGGNLQSGILTCKNVIQQSETPRLRSVNIMAKHGLAMLVEDTGDLREAYEIMYQASQATKEAYGERSIEYAFGLSKLADMKEMNSSPKARKIKCECIRRTMGILLKGKFPAANIFLLETTWKFGLCKLEYDDERTHVSAGVFKWFLQFQETHIKGVRLDPVEVLQRLVDYWESIGDEEALEDALCVASFVVDRCQKLEGLEHTKTKTARIVLTRIQGKWRMAHRGQNKQPTGSAWLQKMRGKGLYNPEGVC